MPENESTEMKVKTGAFAGMTGNRISPTEARSRSFPAQDRHVCVLFLIFGHEVIAAFEPDQVEEVEPNDSN